MSNCNDENEDNKMSAERPHIILIMTDQQRFDTIGSWGNDHMITPNMDRLAREGISFRQAYCPGATCVASRAAIFTGMYPHTTGVYSFDHWGNHRNWVEDLADNGYFCANIGKMHFTPRDILGGFHERVIVENPTNTTHDNGNADDDWGRFLSLNGQVRPNHRQDTDPDWMSKYQGVPWHLEEKYHSDVFIGDSAVSWIRDHKGSKPVFLEVGLTGPHEPWDPLQRHLDMYDDKTLPNRVLREGELNEKPPQHQAHLEAFAEAGGEAKIDLRRATDDDIDMMRRHYYAKITTVDEQVGNVMTALEEKGWLENSLIIFCSDHGEMLGDHGLAYKWLMYDSITHIPLIIRTPGSVGNPSITEDLVSLMDLGPTILEAAGIDVPTYLEGRSLIPYIEGQEIEARAFVVCEDNYQIMMRTDSHKLVYYPGQVEGELYDLNADADELWNRWADAAHAEVKNQLLLRMLEWMVTSNYYNAGYKRNRQRQYEMRWPTEESRRLHGRNSTSPKQIDYL
jgi:arylsulfatase A-like enzyme